MNRKKITSSHNRAIYSQNMAMYRHLITSLYRMGIKWEKLVNAYENIREKAWDDLA